MWIQILHQYSSGEIAAGLERVANREKAEIRVLPKHKCIVIQHGACFSDDQKDVEDVVIVCRQFLIDNEDEMAQKVKYIVFFKRLNGNMMAYGKVMEDFYGSKEMIDARYSPSCGQLTL